MIEDITCDNIKEKYNEFIKQVHPDKNVTTSEDCKAEAQEKTQKLNNKKNECSGTKTSQTGGNSNQENLENFITKISQNLNENSNPNNINVAISKLQLMYALENKDYRILIQKYSKLSDSYNKLIKLEKINKVPITSKPAILTMIDKLFINNLTSNNIEDSEDEEDDLSNYSNTYMLDDEDSVQYKNKNKQKKL